MSNYYAQIDNDNMLVGTSMLSGVVDSAFLKPISESQFYSLRINLSAENTGLFHPKWSGSAWVEGLTQEEIEKIKNPDPPVDELAQIKSDVATMQETINFLLGL